MLTVTDQAKELIAKALSLNEASGGEALRIYLAEDGEFEMGVDTANGDDQVIAVGGRPLVLVDPEVSWDLEGAILDAVEGPDGLDLMLDLPGEDDEDDEAESD